jgi:Acyl-coenzyme A oxidase N-terminal
MIRVFVFLLFEMIRANLPLGVNFDMFVPSIKNFGTEEQQSEWLPRASRCQILGTYAQTELGHGTYIRGLECTATYDARSQEFVINSPTLSSYKVKLYFYVTQFSNYTCIKFVSYALTFEIMTFLGKLPHPLI